MLILMLVILMLLYLNTGYADTDADLCIDKNYVLVLYVTSVFDYEVKVKIHINN